MKIPKYDGEGVYDSFIPESMRRFSGISSRTGLTLNLDRNNVYFNGDWNTYNNWHSKNIVLPWLNKVDSNTAANTDWEKLIVNTLDSWNHAGGFQWMNATPQERQHGMQSDQTYNHLQQYVTNPLLKLQDDIIALNKDFYTYPENANSGDLFEGGTRVGRNGVLSDRDFGIQTGNRRPTINVDTDLETTSSWDNYYKNLGYVGKYKYLNHWVPTKNIDKAEYTFDEKLKTPTLTLSLESKKNFDNIITAKEETIKPVGLKTTLSNIAPDLLEVGRYFINNNAILKIYDETKKSFNPNLILGYHTHRQIYGDEGTRQGYYRRAVQGETKASRPITSDLDRQLAYMMENRRAGNELRMLGDLADNQEIRRTSEESLKHQFSNDERDTQVANANRAEMNRVDALKHTLRALKYSAELTSLDNLLQGIGYKLALNKAEKEALKKQLDAELYSLSLSDLISNDSLLNNLRLEIYKAIDEGKDVIELRKKYNNKLRELQRTAIYSSPTYSQIISAEKGTKITHKKSDKLLYKQTKDAVEHFRKVSKMSAYKDSKHKPEKLVSHPKGSTRKYLLGGLAPFTIYRPVALGGETTTTGGTAATTSSKSSKKEKESEGYLDMIKELFKNVEGLPVDVNTVYSALDKIIRANSIFGNDLSSDDLASMYLRLMLKISLIKYQSAQYENALKNANERDALGEFAIDETGRIAVLNRETEEVEFKSWEDIKEDNFETYNPLTNKLLLDMRALSPNLAFNSRVMSIVDNNAIGINKIAEYLKSQLPKMGTDTIEGYTKQDSNLIKEGLTLLKDAPKGVYHFTNETQEKQALMALNYLERILPRNMKTVLKVHSDIEGVTPKQLIAMMIGASTSSSLKFDAVTGKASKDNGSSSDKIELNSAVRLLLGQSTPREITFNIGNANAFTGVGRISSINDVHEVPFGADFSYSEIYKSSLRTILDLDNASFGDVPINKYLKDHIIVDNSTITGVDLPFTQLSDGRIVPDFLMLRKIEEADEEILRAGIDPDKNPEKVNAIYAKHNLPIKYNGVNRLSGNYKRFAVILASAIEDAFLNKDGLETNGTLELVSDEEEINKYVKGLAKNTGVKEEDIDLDRPGLFTGDKNIYKGSIFIPVIGDLADAISAAGKLTSDIYDDVRKRYETRNYVEAPSYVKK